MLGLMTSYSSYVTVSAAAKQNSVCVTLLERALQSSFHHSLIIHYSFSLLSVFIWAHVCPHAPECPIRRYVWRSFSSCCGENTERLCSAAPVEGGVTSLQTHELLVFIPAGVTLSFHKLQPGKLGQIWQALFWSL